MNHNAVLAELWAKSPLPGEKAETLLAHTEAVVQALAGIARLRPDLHTATPIPRLWHWAFWACCLHDLGKAAKDFQTMLRRGGKWGHRHEVLSLMFVDCLPFPSGDTEWIAAAVAAHHRDADELERDYPLDMPADDPYLADLVAQVDNETVKALLAALEQLTEGWRRMFGFDRLGVESPGNRWQEWEASSLDAAKSVCGRLRSFYRLVRSLRRGEENSTAALVSLLLRGLLVTADHTASAHVEPPPPSLQGVSDLLQRLHLRWEQLYDHQRSCALTSGSIILTAPTGSGKTESALLWAAQQCEQAKGAPRLFYVLPFQASMNAMLQRLRRFFPHNEVGLQHGRSLQALYRAYLQSEATPEQALRLAHWARRLTNLHACPLKVLSPYQLLKACYRLRGYEAVFTDCFGGLFIFDEMHAYEPQRLAMIIAMMRFMRERLRARFCVMTATMPPPIVEHLQQALGESLQVQAAETFRRHWLELIGDEITTEANCRRIGEAASAGEAVLVCCNTVRRAQEIYTALKARLPNVKVDLLHSRFTVRDRLRKEGALAKDPTRPTRPEGVLVATQVVEVSLNLDFDTIFTEPAPLEALWQRFGRVNRVGRIPLAPVHVFRQPTDGQHIYNPLMVQQTLAVLESAHGEPLDEREVATWLGQIYAGELLRAWTAQFVTAAREFEATCLHTLHGFDSDEGLEDSFARAFDSIDVLPACFATEYNRLMQSDPLLAAELLVGISSRQYQKLRAENRLQLPYLSGHPPIVLAPYSTELGLSLEHPGD